MEQSNNSTAWQYKDEKEKTLADHIIGLEKSALAASCMAICRATGTCGRSAVLLIMMV